MNDIIPNFKFLNMLADGPDTQISPEMGAMIRGLDNKPLEEVKSSIRKAMDFGARYAMCSGFVINVLEVEWVRLGGKHSDPTPWREEIEAEEGF